MSNWVYISGTITVSPLGRSQAEKRYILDTVLAHLPRVTGSEEDMNIYAIQKNGHNYSSSCDEFEQFSNLYNEKYFKTFEMQDDYLIIVDGNLCDRTFNETLREFTKWLCRLSKRVLVTDIIVIVKGYDKKHIFDNHSPYFDMFELPSWHYEPNEQKEPNWCEFMMWDRAKDSNLPIMLEYKYFNNEENDKEVERRRNYGN